MEVKRHAGASGWIGGQLKGPAALTGGVWAGVRDCGGGAPGAKLAKFYRREMRRVDPAFVS